MSRALLIAERFPPDLGGLARSSHRTALSLSKLGIEVEVLAWTKTLPPGAIETHEPNETQRDSANAGPDDNEGRNR